MSKTLLIYHLNGNDSNRIKFNRKLFNYKTQSHKGKYEQTTKGILTKYEKPVRSAVIFDDKKTLQIKKLLNEFNIAHKMYKIQNITT